MKIITNAIKDGAFALEFGNFGPKDKNGMPHISFPFAIEDYPKETKAFALIFIDYDAVPVSGAPFIHWLVSDFVSPVMPKGESHQGRLIEGINSWYDGRNHRDDAHGYGGMAP
ncbi:MAG: YbhB/YbcL family Raf kinase inhibitor-like protein, partial [Syntrophomonadaceae bacterium]